MPDDTERSVPVSASASMPPIGTDRATPTTVITGNLAFWYSPNSSRKISPTVMGRTICNWLRLAVYSSYSPPQTAR